MPDRNSLMHTSDYADVFSFLFQNTLKHRADCPTLLMDIKKIFPLDLVFTPSAVALETIEIPASLNLGFLTQI